MNIIQSGTEYRSSHYCPVQDLVYDEYRDQSIGLITENPMKVTSMPPPKKEYFYIVHSRKFIFVWFPHCFFVCFGPIQSLFPSVCPRGWCETPDVKRGASVPLWGDKLVTAHQSDPWAEQNWWKQVEGGKWADTTGLMKNQFSLLLWVQPPGFLYRLLKCSLIV